MFTSLLLEGNQGHSERVPQWKLFVAVLRTSEVCSSPESSPRGMSEVSFSKAKIRHRSIFGLSFVKDLPYIHLRDFYL